MNNKNLHMMPYKNLKSLTKRKLFCIHKLCYRLTGQDVMRFLDGQFIALNHLCDGQTLQHVKNTTVNVKQKI